MYEDGADLCVVASRVENAGAALCAAVGDARCVAAAERAAITPATARDQLVWLIHRRGDKVGLVCDQLAIYAEGAADGGVDLRGRVVTGLQATHRGLDERQNCGDILGDSGADGKRNGR